MDENGRECAWTDKNEQEPIVLDRNQQELQALLQPILTNRSIIETKLSPSCEMLCHKEELTLIKSVASENPCSASGVSKRIGSTDMAPSPRGHGRRKCPPRAIRGGRGNYSARERKKKPGRAAIGISQAVVLERAVAGPVETFAGLPTRVGPEGPTGLAILVHGGHEEADVTKGRVFLLRRRNVLDVPHPRSVGTSCKQHVLGRERFLHRSYRVW
ncbi:uncharacterized protein LOC143347663 [Colletes latitarsis]|uniref:uncharacterized protein LOC143347663 n=1 Tax=Colletes latitarsis TaxID=2605962 RepID=UPI0040352B39